MYAARNGKFCIDQVNWGQRLCRKCWMKKDLCKIATFANGFDLKLLNNISIRQMYLSLTPKLRRFGRVIRDDVVSISYPKSNVLSLRRKRPCFHESNRH